MIEHTFLHVPTIGEKREAGLWERGYTDWDRFRLTHPDGPFKEHVLRYLVPDLVAQRLSRAQAWRLFTTHREKVLYLDIETTGLRGGEDAVTCIGTYDGKKVRAYVQGRDLDRFEDALDEAELLITYNGASFDLPFLKAAFSRWNFARPKHIDLRFPLRRLGFKGGLKGIEPQLGVYREEAIKGVDGFTAVQLWRAHEHGHPRALETLVRYCLEDVVNLEPLMIETFNRMTAALPIDVPRLEIPERPWIPYRADTELVRDLVGASIEREGSRLRVW